MRLLLRRKFPGGYKGDDLQYVRSWVILLGKIEHHDGVLDWHLFGGWLVRMFKLRCGHISGCGGCLRLQFLCHGHLPDCVWGICMYQLSRGYLFHDYRGTTFRHMCFLRPRPLFNGRWRGGGVDMLKLRGGHLVDNQWRGGLHGVSSLLDGSVSTERRRDVMRLVLKRPIPRRDRKHFVQLVLERVVPSGSWWHLLWSLCRGSIWDKPRRILLLELQLGNVLVGRSHRLH